MVNVALVQRKVMRFRSALDRLAAKNPMTLEAFLRNEDAQDIVCRNLQLAIQVCIDVATHVVADEGWSPPKDLAGLVGVLHAHSVIDESSATAMRKAIGFRNVLVHEYDVLDMTIVHSLWQARAPDLARFIDQIIRHFHLDQGL